MTVSPFESLVHSRDSDASIVVRPVESVLGLASHCHELSHCAGVEGRDPSTFALFGSAVRAFWTGERWGDVNVALDIGALPRAIIAQADFTVCQVAVRDGHLFYTTRFLEDVSRRVIAVNRVDACAPMVTLLRMYKYAARGYTIPGSALHEVLEAVRRAPRPRLDAATILRHGGGVVTP